MYQQCVLWWVYARRYVGCLYVGVQYMSRYYDMFDTNVGDGDEISMYMYILGRAPPLPKRSGAAIDLALLR